MQETRGNWTDLIAGVGLEIAEVYDQGQEEYIPGIASVLNTSTGKGAQKNFTGKTGAGRLSLFDDGDDMPGGKRYKTYTTKIQYNNYGKWLDVTANTMEDRGEEFDEDLDEMKDLSITANFSQDEAGLQLFNGGFSTTQLVNSYKMNWYGDGKAQYSTVHPTVVPGASTNSNASATSIKFGHDNLEIGKIALTEAHLDDGLPMAMLGKETLVGPLALDREFKEECESVLTPESANNAINVYKGTQDYVTSMFLSASNNGSDTAWFLVVPGRAKIYHEVRQATQLNSDVSIKSKTMTFTVDSRWANYSKDWRRTWGTKGDLSTYSG